MRDIKKSSGGTAGWGEIEFLAELSTLLTGNAKFMHRMLNFHSLFAERGGCFGSGISGGGVP